MKPVYYDCEICGHLHPWEFNGDCRDNSMRFTCAEIDAKHRRDGYEVRTMEERVDADNAQERDDGATESVEI